MTARLEHRADSDRGYRPIRDYAVIGDLQTAALVASDGAIDWWCCPRFDSPAIFCRLLDARRSGWCRVGAAGRHASVRQYLLATNVLTTRLRDSALVLYALQTVGLHKAALRFFDWLEAMCIGYVRSRWRGGAR